DCLDAMMRAISYAGVLSVAVYLQAVAQTTVTPYSVTSGGVVALGKGTTALTATTGANPSSATVAQPPSSTTTGTTATGPTFNAAGPSSGPGGVPAGTPSSASRPSRAPSTSSRSSGGSSASATGAASSNVPAWLLCPPPGASGIEPFVTGTNLSCAP